MLRPDQGYGSVARQLVLAVEQLGIDVRMAPTFNEPPPGFERFYRRFDERGRIGFYYHYFARPGIMPCPVRVNYWMWETTRLPAEPVAEINSRVALQYVPCRQNIESFRESGVEVPIKVLHHGVDTEQFPYLKRSHGEMFTFGTFGDLGPRKGIDVLLRAFRDEFRKDEPVRLMIKGALNAPAYQLDDPRITLICGFMPQHELLEFLRRMDVFVLPSRGEGFGLCGIEAMSTGLPLIATNWSGPAEYLDPADSFPLNYRLVEAGGVESNYVRYYGQWAEPDYEHLRQLMRWTCEYRDESANRGKLASARVRAHWSWQRIAKQLRGDLDELAASNLEQ
jgi:glycosyltransferase involved in cell wall biosynthesis